MNTPYTRLFTAEQYRQLLVNGRKSHSGEEHDPLPVVKLFTPDAGATWLLSEIDPEEPSLAFGLCDLGLGCPELGYVSLDELVTLRGQRGLPVVRDLHFTPTMTLAAYADLARQHSRIIA